jgi:hypothetical protein
MPPLVYPVLPGLAFPVVKTPQMQNLQVQAFGGQRVSQLGWVNPLWAFGLTYNYLRTYVNATANGVTAAEVDLLLGFFLTMGGDWQYFYYKDPDWNVVVDGPLSVTTVGGTKYSQIVRTIGGFPESVCAVNGVLAIKLNGVLQTPGVDYTFDPTQIGFTGPGVSWDGQYITWITNPGANPVTATFNYYFPCQFAEGKGDYEKFLSNVYKNGKVNLLQVRVTSSSYF